MQDVVTGSSSNRVEDADKEASSYAKDSFFEPSVRTILLITEDRALARQCSDYLGGKYRIVSAKPGSFADLFVKLDRDTSLVLLELDDLRQNSIVLLREIKRRSPRVPVIVLAARSDERVAVDAFRSGARDYLKKPFTRDELLSRVDFCFSLKTARQDQRACLQPVERSAVAGNGIGSISGGLELRMRQTLRFIDDNFMKQIDLDVVSKQAGLSRFRFSREFRKMNGVTFRTYIAQRRIEAARTLLQNHRLTVTEISHAVGYGDPNNFIRNFRKLTSQTPTEFRFARASSS
jgi:AraC-like DNA-binding protein